VLWGSSGTQKSNRLFLEQHVTGSSKLNYTEWNTELSLPTYVKWFASPGARGNTPSANVC